MGASDLSLIRSPASRYPIKVYRRLDDGSSKRIYSSMLLGDDVSGGGPQVPGEARYDWIFSGTVAALLHGTGWGYITNRSGIPGSDGLGLPTGIAWLPNDRISVMDNEQQPENPLKARIYYKGHEVNRSDLITLKAFTVPGRVEGISPLRAFASLISQGLQALEYSHTWFDSGGFPTGTFQNISEEVTEQQARQIRSQLVDTIRMHQPLVYGRDWDFKALSVPPNEAIFVTGMQLNATQIAAIYGVQPGRVGGTRADGLTYSNVTQNQLDELQTTLRPWLRRWESLLTSLLPSTQYAKFDVDEYLRMDPHTRNEVYQIQRNIGTRTANEIRDDDDRSPLQSGDDPIPLLMLERMASTTRSLPKSVMPLVQIEADHIADLLQTLEKENPQLINPMTADKPPLQATPEQYLGRLMTQVRSVPEPADSTVLFGPAAIRASDSDRDKARKLLAAHGKAGRLRGHEVDQRSVKASEAVTCGDLATLFSDLPVAMGPPKAATAAIADTAGPESLDEDRSADAQPLFGPAALALLHERAEYAQAALAATNGKAH
jgi:HK97 family phage portal protein